MVSVVSTAEAVIAMPRTMTTARSRHMDFLKIFITSSCQKLSFLL